METTPSKGMFIIVISFMVAIGLLLFPLPDFLIWWRPNWVLMVVIYWTLALPHRIGIFAAWVLGIITDVALSSVLGVHGLTMAIVAYLILLLNKRLRLFPLWKQSIIVGLMVGLDLVLSLWLQNFISTQPRHAMYWLPIISSIFFWPWIFILLRDIRRKFQIR